VVSAAKTESSRACVLDLRPSVGRTAETGLACAYALYTASLRGGQLIYPGIQYASPTESLTIMQPSSWEYITMALPSTGQAKTSSESVSMTQLLFSAELFQHLTVAINTLLWYRGLEYPVSLGPLVRSAATLSTRGSFFSIFFPICTTFNQGVVYAHT